MHPTIEIRWFTQGELPDEIVSWYEDAVGLVDWDERTDRYVRPVAPDGLNVKWREGNIEIKRKVDDVGIGTWGPVTGKIERWRKWSFPIAEELPLPASGRDWMAVAKRRAKRAFGPKDDHLVLLKPGTQMPDGCTVEIAEIRHQQQAWWTLCLEAFGPDAEAQDLIQRIGERIFSEDGTPSLHDDASMSYVRWLSDRSSTD